MRVVAARNQFKCVLLVEGVGGGAGKPGEPVRVKAVIPRKREGERIHRVVQLSAAADRWLLVPQEAALDVHVLECEGIFSADQRRQFASLDRKRIGRLEFQIRYRQGGEEIAGRLLRVEIRRADGIV
jgi:hypothetical protein